MTSTPQRIPLWVWKVINAKAIKVLSWKVSYQVSNDVTVRRENCQLGIGDRDHSDTIRRPSAHEYGLYLNICGGSLESHGLLNEDVEV